MSDKPHDILADSLDDIASAAFKLVRSLCGDRIGLIVAVTRRMHRWAEMSETSQLIDWADEIKKANDEPDKAEVK